MNNAEQIEPGIYGNTDPGNVNAIVNGLAQGMSIGDLATSLPSLATGAAGMLNGLGNAGEIALGAAPDVSATLNGLKVVNTTPDGITIFIKGIQKGVNGAEAPIYGVTGPADKLLAHFGDVNPGSVPEHILRAKGFLPVPTPLSQQATNPLAEALKEKWANAALEQSGTPLKTRAYYANPEDFAPKGE